MRPLPFILGIFAAMLCIAPAEAQNGGWCAYNNYAYGGQRVCGFVTLQQCLAEVRGVGATRRRTISGIGGAILIDRAIVPQKLRQLSDIGGNPPRRMAKGKSNPIRADARASP